MVKPETWHNARVKILMDIENLELNIKLAQRNLKFIESMCAKHPIQKPQTGSTVIPPKAT